MAPKSRANCQICEATESKYTCSTCSVVYCSVPCYRKHKESSCKPQPEKDDGDPPLPSESSVQPVETPASASASVSTSTSASDQHQVSNADEESSAPIPQAAPLRSLASLNWPYVEEPSAYPDPLKRDDPKPLTLASYEALATSQAVREALVDPELRRQLMEVDALRGEEREWALQRALGVDGRGAGSFVRKGDGLGGREKEEGTEAFRRLAEAIEGAVRGKQALGLDWDA